MASLAARLAAQEEKAEHRFQHMVHLLTIQQNAMRHLRSEVDRFHMAQGQLPRMGGTDTEAPPSEISQNR
ncbi:UNVERIFIED_CONTAM: hypothetical protein K2H54_047719 [Gekko kuhli]